VSNSVVLTDPTNKAVSLPLVSGTLGPSAVDIGKLHKETGLFTYDPGFMSTASTRSAITYIDGDAGVLLYRGYPIEQLAKHSNFLEVAYLLLNGELPNARQFSEFEHEITHHTMMRESMRHFLNGFHYDAHPMAMLCAVVGSLAAFYHDSTDIDDPKQRYLAAIRLIAKMPTIAAAAYRYSIGWPIRFPRNNLEYCTRFLHMMFELPSEKLELPPVAAKALDLLFILHADHEQNASTSTVRLIGSTGANPYACVAGGIAALWGPAHGGANEAVLKMLEEIGTPDQVGKAVEKAKDKNSGFRLMGFGHRVYKSYDPRARIVKQLAHEVFAQVGMDRDLEIALELERIALEDPYFIERRLYPNVDFYTGLIYRSMAFPTDFFTVLFAVARVAGWLAQWEEMILDREQKIARPRQVYVGPGERPYVDRLADKFPRARKDSIRK
jgi:citrate synthase